MPNKQIILFVITLLLTHSTVAQKKNVDSLLVVWNSSSEPDSNRVSAYRSYVWDTYIYSNPDTAIILAEKLHEYSKRHNYPDAKARAYNLQATGYYIKGDYDISLDLHQKCLAIDRELGNKKGIGACLNNMANIYRQQGDYYKAITTYQESIKIKREIGNRKGVGASYNNIAIVYKKLGKYLKAIEYYEKSLTIKDEIGDSKGKATTLMNIGIIYRILKEDDRALENYKKALKIHLDGGYLRGAALVYSNIGSLYLALRDYDLANEYFTKALRNYESLGAKKGIATVSKNLGVLYRSEGKYELSLQSFNKSLKISREIGDKELISENLNGIGLVKLQKKEFQAAIEGCKESLKLSKELNQVMLNKEGCICLYKAYKSIGNADSALYYKEQADAYDRKISETEANKKLLQIDFNAKIEQDSLLRLEEAKRIEEEHQEVVQGKNETRNSLILAAVFLSLLAIAMFLRVRYVRRTKRKVEREKEVSENILSNILPTEIANELKEKGYAETRDFENVSVLFTDFKSFTETTQKLNPKELITEINVCFKEFDEICEKYSIEKIKTIGDAYMAVGGLPNSGLDSAKKTVLVAIEMQKFITNRKKNSDSTNTPAFEMRAGIHTGPVVAGIVGVKKFQYDIWGDTVNTASRMESHGEVGKVAISDATYQLLKDDTDLIFERRGKIAVKGKGEMEVWFVDCL